MSLARKLFAFYTIVMARSSTKERCPVSLCSASYTTKLVCRSRTCTRQRVLEGITLLNTVCKLDDRAVQHSEAGAAEEHEGCGTLNTMEERKRYTGSIASLTASYLRMSRIYKTLCPHEGGERKTHLLGVEAFVFTILTFLCTLFIFNRTPSEL